MGEEAAELRLDLGGLGRVMCCVAGQEVWSWWCIFSNQFVILHFRWWEEVLSWFCNISKDLIQLHFEVVVVHSQDEERDEVVVVFCVNTGRLLGTFEGSRESLLGGGVLVFLSDAFLSFYI